jgi:phage tail-like protein
MGDNNSQAELDTSNLLGSFMFLFEVETLNHDDRKIVGGFNSISGGGVKIEKRDVTHGDDRYKRHMPGAIEYENITLSRGMTSNKDLLDWFKNILDGKNDRRSGTIIIMENDYDEGRRFEFFGAYPCSFSGVELSSDGSAMSLEKFELCVERTEWK